MEYDKLARIEKLLESDINIIDALSNNRTNNTTTIDEMISYDLRAGIDTEEYYKNPGFTIKVVDRILHYIEGLKIDSFSILECGCGEGIKLVNVLNRATKRITWAGGLDISWSRIKCAKEFHEKNGKLPCSFFVADMFNLPFSDSSVDIIYTLQGIYAMGGREQQLISELLRVTSRFLILIEPSYELAGDEARARMVRLNYVKGLKYTAEFLGCNVILYELFGVDSNPDNPAAVMIIEKTYLNRNSPPKVQICDPITKKPLSNVKNVFFSSKSKLSYPIIDGIPCLASENAILTSRLL